MVGVGGCILSNKHRGVDHLVGVHRSRPRTFCCLCRCLPGPLCVQQVRETMRGCCVERGVTENCLVDKVGYYVC